jgi:hypothetical protein
MRSAQKLAPLLRPLPLSKGIVRMIVCKARGCWPEWIEFHVTAFQKPSFPISDFGHRGLGGTAN